MSNTEPTGFQTIIISYKSHPCLIFLKSLITHSALKCLIKEEHNGTNHMRHVMGTRNAITMATLAFPQPIDIVEIFHFSVTQPKSLKYQCN